MADGDVSPIQPVVSSFVILEFYLTLNWLLIHIPVPQYHMILLGPGNTLVSGSSWSTIISM